MTGCSPEQDWVSGRRFGPLSSLSKKSVQEPEKTLPKTLPQKNEQPPWTRKGKKGDTCDRNYGWNKNNGAALYGENNETLGLRNLPLAHSKEGQG